jgi:hypothetical protein
MHVRHEIPLRYLTETGIPEVDGLQGFLFQPDGLMLYPMPFYLANIEPMKSLHGPIFETVPQRALSESARVKCRFEYPTLVRLII